MEKKRFILDNGVNRAVNEDRIKELTVFLSKLNEQGLTEELKEKGLKLVKSISPLELSMAEQSLIDDGMNASELRHLCEIHMLVLKDELEKLKSNISTGHVLYTMVEEHECLLKFLDEIEETTKVILAMDKYDVERAEFNKIPELALNLLNAEPHHKREEEVLFKEVEELGVTGPTRIMRMEHEELRKKKRALRDLGRSVGNMEFEEYKKKLKDISNAICYELRDHIFKENYILYPTSLETITDEGKWQEMKEKCDMVGYCTFTPENSK
ncbi:hypothetical protein SDC9_42152 [bioreactor metagenome]|uniref:Hemerythrin-like domain-containing protein n=1 Tax=bioreactor metagenome TaxID=1076179 RepID=A0A644VX89_9ZZZZ